MGIAALHPSYANDFAISRRDAPEVCPSFPAPGNPRAQGRPGARCTRGLVRGGIVEKCCTRAYRFSGEHPAFPAQWLYGLLRALPGERLFCLRHPMRSFASQRFDASTATSGPHDFTVRLMCVRPAHQTSTAPHRAFVTIASAPRNG